MDRYPVSFDEKYGRWASALPTTNQPGPQTVWEEGPREDRRRKCGRRRKFRILAHFMFFWLGFILLIYHLWGWFETYLPRSSNEIHQVEDLLSSTLEWPIPPDLTLKDCADWQDPGIATTSLKNPFTSYEPFSSLARFSLPISSEKLFMISRGMAAGSITVRHGDDKESDNREVKIEVVAHYRYRQALESVKVCTVKRGEGNNGLGIFGPEWNRHNLVQFQVTLTLPKDPKAPTYEVNDFETDAPLFKHEIKDLESAVYFKSIKLKSANVPMTVDALNATDASVETINGPITGHFHTSSFLKLLTANAHIDVTVAMFNDDNDKKESATELQTRTSNARVTASLVLESSNKSGGRYKVVTSTANAPIDLEVKDAPIDSVLQLDARTSLGSARVSLHPTYEGAFSAASSLKRPEVIVDRVVKDPAGRGRERKVDLYFRGATAAGKVWWSDGKNKEEPLGSVHVSTSWAPVTLLL